jgi:hypothetical protein
MVESQYLLLERVIAANFISLGVLSNKMVIRVDSRNFLITEFSKCQDSISYRAPPYLLKITRCGEKSKSEFESITRYNAEDVMVSYPLIEYELMEQNAENGWSSLVKGYMSPKDMASIRIFRNGRFRQLNEMWHLVGMRLSPEY